MSRPNQLTAARSRLHVYRETHALCGGLDANHVKISLTTKPSNSPRTKYATIGVMSIIPIDGMTRLNGRRSGSVNV